jgi:hypothetical protein
MHSCACVLKQDMTASGSRGFSVQHRFEGAIWERQDCWDARDASLSGSSYLKLPWLSAVVDWKHRLPPCASSLPPGAQLPPSRGSRSRGGVSKRDDTDDPAGASRSRLRALGRGAPMYGEIPIAAAEVESERPTRSRDSCCVSGRRSRTPLVVWSLPYYSTSCGSRLQF